MTMTKICNHTMAVRGINLNKTWPGVHNGKPIATIAAKIDNPVKKSDGACAWKKKCLLRIENTKTNSVSTEPTNHAVCKMDTLF